MRVALALVLHELRERTRDRWVLIVSVLFMMLSAGVTLYGRGAGAEQAAVTAPSVVTLAAFLVPLVALVLGHDAIVGERERNTLGLLLSLPVGRAEVLLAKLVGRGLALLAATAAGLGASAALLPAGSRGLVMTLIGPTLLLGASFLSLGVAISALVRRRATAASLAVVCWFLLVFFYDLGLLAGMVATDGALGQDTVAWAVALNPAGLYRTGLLVDMVGVNALAELGLTVALPGTGQKAAIWAAWIGLPAAVGVVSLQLRQTVSP